MFKNTLILTAKLAALLAVSFKAAEANAENGFFVLSALAFSCLFVLDLFVSNIKPSRVAGAAFSLAGIAGCFLIDSADYYPVLLILLLELIEVLAGGYSYRLSMLYALTALLSYFIFSPSVEAIASAGAILLVFIPGRILAEKLEKTRETLSDERERSAALGRRISQLEQYAKTIRETAAMEERSRFSARIHDKLGHSISGNIILLEGARLNVRTNPEKAEECIDRATASLRSGVDDIRAALREERPDPHVIGAAEIDERLKSFALKYGVKANVAIDGDVRRITPPIWKCINENLGEAMTNMLKHSSGTELNVSVSVYNKVIRAEIIDNGVCGAEIKRGIGLDAMEERTLLCGGKCFFRSGAKGFSVVTVFQI